MERKNCSFSDVARTFDLSIHSAANHLATATNSCLIFFQEQPINEKGGRLGGLACSNGSTCPSLGSENTQSCIRNSLHGRAMYV